MRQEKERPRRVLGYARVSSIEQEQHGTSLDGQRADLLRFCKERGYPTPEIRVEVESGGLGKEEQRAEQVRLMNDVRPGDVVLVCKQDRWSRDTLHFLASSRKIMTTGARFVSIAEEFDPSTPEGEYASTMMAATARYEHGRIRDRTVGTRRRLRAAGAFVEGLPPIGYTVQDRKLIVEPKGAAVVKFIFKLCASGSSVREISAAVREKFVWAKGLDPAGVARRLHDRRYIGETNTVGSKRGKPTGEWVSTHEPIIDVVTWRRAQASLEARKASGRPLTETARNAGFLLRGLIFCGHCGRVLVAHAPGPDASVTHGGYYLCRRRTEARRLDAERCEGPIARYADVDAQADREALARLEALVDKLVQPPRPRPEEKRPDYAGERAKLLQRRSNLVNAIADGVITADMAREKMVTIQKGLDAIEDRRAREGAGAEPVIDRAAMLGQVTELRRAWEALLVEDKREALRLLADRIDLFSTASDRWERGAWKLKITWKKVN